MPSEFSIYRKIQVILEEVKSTDMLSLRDLENEIAAKKLTIFLTRQYDKKIDDYKLQTSIKTIRRTINLCRQLGLLDSTGALTREGRESLSGMRFDKIVSSRIRMLLQESGVNIQELNEVILDKLRLDSPVMPTAKELWKASNTKMRLSLFSRMLTLLGHCSGAVSSQRKIYLSIGIG